MRHSSNGFYLRFIKENTQSHKPRCSWTNLILMCPELISYFISKRYKKAFPEVLQSSFMKENNQFYKARYSCWKTWYCISSFLLTTEFQSWITKKKHLPKFSSQVLWQKTIRPTSPDKSPCCLIDIIQCVANSSNKDITFRKPKEQVSLKARAICEKTKWPQFQFSMSQLSEIL